MAGVDASSLSFAKRTLSNGLDVIVHEDHHVPDRCRKHLVPRWFQERTSRHDRLCASLRAPDVRGVGSTTTPATFRRIQRAGGLLNGSTNTDRTNYWEVVPTSAIDLALWMESDRMGYLLPAVTPRAIRNPARRRAQRAAAELREPALRVRAHGDCRGAVPASSIPTTGRRSGRSRISARCAWRTSRRSSGPTITRPTRR